MKERQQRQGLITPQITGNAALPFSSPQPQVTPGQQHQRVVSQQFTAPTQAPPQPQPQVTRSNSQPVPKGLPEQWQAALIGWDEAHLFNATSALVQRLNAPGVGVSV